MDPPMALSMGPPQRLVRYRIEVHSPQNGDNAKAQYLRKYFVKLAPDASVRELCDAAVLRYRQNYNQELTIKRVQDETCCDVQMQDSVLEFFNDHDVVRIVQAYPDGHRDSVPPTSYLRYNAPIAAGFKRGRRAASPQLNGIRESSAEDRPPSKRQRVPEPELHRRPEDQPIPSREVDILPNEISAQDRVIPDSQEHLDLENPRSRVEPARESSQHRAMQNGTRETPPASPVSTAVTTPHSAAPTRSAVGASAQKRVTNGFASLPPSSNGPGSANRKPRKNVYEDIESDADVEIIGHNRITATSLLKLNGEGQRPRNPKFKLPISNIPSGNDKSNGLVPAEEDPVVIEERRRRAEMNLEKAERDRKAREAEEEARLAKQKAVELGKAEKPGRPSNARKQREDRDRELLEAHERQQKMEKEEAARLEREKRKEAAERRKLEEEEAAKQKKLEEDRQEALRNELEQKRVAEEKQRIAEEERQRVAEEEKQRIAEEERQRVAEERQRVAEEEKRRVAEERQRVAEEERQREIAAQKAAKIAQDPQREAKRAQQEKANRHAGEESTTESEAESAESEIPAPSPKRRRSQTTVDPVSGSPSQQREKQAPVKRKGSVAPAIVPQAAASTPRSILPPKLSSSAARSSLKRTPSHRSSHAVTSSSPQPDTSLEAQLPLPKEKERRVSFVDNGNARQGPMTAMKVQPAPAANESRILPPPSRAKSVARGTTPKPTPNLPQTIQTKAATPVARGTAPKSTSILPKGKSETPVPAPTVRRGSSNAGSSRPGTPAPAPPSSINTKASVRSALLATGNKGKSVPTPPSNKKVEPIVIGSDDEEESDDAEEEEKDEDEEDAPARGKQSVSANSKPMIKMEPKDTDSEGEEEEEEEGDGSSEEGEEEDGSSEDEDQEMVDAPAPSSQGKGTSRFFLENAKDQSDEAGDETSEDEEDEEGEEDAHPQVDSKSKASIKEPKQATEDIESERESDESDSDSSSKNRSPVRSSQTPPRYVTQLPKQSQADVSTQSHDSANSAQVPPALQQSDTESGSDQEDEDEEDEQPAADPMDIDDVQEEDVGETEGEDSDELEENSIDEEPEPEKLKNGNKPDQTPTPPDDQVQDQLDDQLFASSQHPLASHIRSPADKSSGTKSDHDQTESNGAVDTFSSIPKTQAGESPIKPPASQSSKSTPKSTPKSPVREPSILPPSSRSTPKAQPRASSIKPASQLSSSQHARASESTPQSQDKDGSGRSQTLSSTNPVVFSSQFDSSQRKRPYPSLSQLERPSPKLRHRPHRPSRLSSSQLVAELGTDDDEESSSSDSDSDSAKASDQSSDDEEESEPTKKDKALAAFTAPGDTDEGEYQDVGASSSSSDDDKPAQRRRSRANSSARKSPPKAAKPGAKFEAKSVNGGQVQKTRTAGKELKKKKKKDNSMSLGDIGAMFASQ